MLVVKRARGTKLVDGRRTMADKEIILSYVALHTLSYLCFRGIETASELAEFSIPQIVELPVGQYLHDHGAINILWRLKKSYSTRLNT